MVIRDNFNKANDNESKFATWKVLIILNIFKRSTPCYRLRDKSRDRFPGKRKDWTGIKQRFFNINKISLAIYVWNDCPVFPKKNLRGQRSKAWSRPLIISCVLSKSIVSFK